MEMTKVMRSLLVFFIALLLILNPSIIYGNHTHQNENSHGTPIENHKEVQHDDHSEDSLKYEHKEHKEKVTGVDHVHGAVPAEEHGEHGDSASHDEGGHGSDMSPLLFVILALIIGAATRQLLSKIFLPYTVSLLIIGLALGVLQRIGIFDNGLESIGKAIQWAGSIDPHVILYVFLPTLIFEAAFAMDVYTFKKTSTNSFLLAVPGILVAMFLTGSLVIGLGKFGLGLETWGWSLALMFGAVISATDPVAVVALLKELGASKKLGTLIEGESLLNDGTAIVIFMVFLTAIQGIGGDASPVIQFIYVAGGGIVLGLLVGVFTISWVRKVFNDALVEISIIVAAAYLTFFVAEHFLHVSGVLGLVAFGLSMAGRGKTRISPEVEHFLHEFWELAAFIANTLIFIVVGMVIAQVKFVANDFLILGILYIGIHVVRAIVIFILYPFMKKAGYGLPKKDAYVVWYGALRGAIGLALALVVAGESRIPADIRNQFLFYTAGIVTLTLCVNATTIRFLVDKLGLTKIPPAKKLMIKNANQYLRQSTRNAKERLKKDRFMGHADWKEVDRYFHEVEGTVITGEIKIDTMAETRRRILEKEKSSYWHQFKEGLIGSAAVINLTEQIKEILDKGGTMPLSERMDLEDLWKTPRLFDKLQSIPIIGKLIESFFFERLTVSYDCARGFVEAQEETLKLADSMHNSLAKEGKKEELENLSEIESEINENRIHGLTFLRILRKNYPEIYDAISTRQAIRSLLNYELRTVERLQSNGRIDSGEAEKMTHHIEERMKRLMEKPPKVKLPDNDEILWGIPWLKDLEPNIFHKAVSMFHKRVYAVNEDITKADTPADSVFIIVRGTVKIASGKDVKALLGPGDTIGEVSVMMGLPRDATVTAVSPVTVLRIKFVKLLRLMKEAPIIKSSLWDIAGKRYAENMLASMEPYSDMNKKQFNQWIHNGEVFSPGDNELEMKNRVGILLEGEAHDLGKKKKLEIIAPNILAGAKFSFSDNAYIYLSPENKD